MRLLVKVAGALCYTVDVSDQGLCVTTSRPLARGKAVEGMLLAAGRVFPFSGRVAWGRTGRPSRGEQSLMGIEFVSVPYEFRRLMFPVEPLS